MNKPTCNAIIEKNKKEIYKIAVLRLDGDFYESTKTVLDSLYDSVSVGGYVVIDDFGFPGCRIDSEDPAAKTPTKTVFNNDPRGVALSGGQAGNSQGSG